MTPFSFSFPEWDGAWGIWTPVLVAVGIMVVLLIVAIAFRSADWALVAGLALIVMVFFGGMGGSMLSLFQESDYDHDHIISALKDHHLTPVASSEYVDLNSPLHVKTEDGSIVLIQIIQGKKDYTVVPAKTIDTRGISQ